MVKKRESYFLRSLRQHGDPANFALHIVSAPFLVLGLLLRRIDLVLVAVFYILAGSLYGWVGRERTEQIWITLYKSNVNKWFTFLGFILIGVGLWSRDLIVILIGIGSFAFGLLYVVLTRR